MGEKKENGGCGGQEGKNKEEKKGGGPGAVVLKIDMHCEGCANKIIKCAKAFEGVEKAKVEWEASKLTVEGKVDPAKLRQKLQEKTKKKVELVSPQTKKDKQIKENDDDNNSKKNTNNGSQEKKADEKKPKEPPVTTAVLKLGLHCQGCVQKIEKFVKKTSGVKSVSIDQQKDLVTVKGTMDVKALAEALKGRMKRVVEIVPQKKENEKGKENEGKKQGNNGSSGGGGNEKKGGGSGNGNGNNNANGGGKKGGGGGADGGNNGGNRAEENGFPRMEGSRMEFHGTVGYPANAGYGYGFGGGYGYGYTYGENVHAPQYFSDENPNACSVM